MMLHMRDIKRAFLAGMIKDAEERYEYPDCSKVYIYILTHEKGLIVTWHHNFCQFNDP